MDPLFFIWICTLRKQTSLVVIYLFSFHFVLTFKPDLAGDLRRIRIRWAGYRNWTRQPEPLRCFVLGRPQQHRVRKQWRQMSIMERDVRATATLRVMERTTIDGGKGQIWRLQSTVDHSKKKSFFNRKKAGLWVNDSCEPAQPAWREAQAWPEGERSSSPAGFA